MFWNRKKQTESKKETKREFREVKREMEKLKPYSLPTPENSFFAMDSKSKFKKTQNDTGLNPCVINHFISDGFLGYQLLAQISKNWLVNKAIKLPVEDCLRQGYNINNEEYANTLKEQAVKFKVDDVLKQALVQSRAQGGALVLIVVNSIEKDYYEDPFNIDSFKKGTLEGFKCIDLSFVTPEVLVRDIQNPASMNYYEPTFYNIKGKRYHKSHFIKLVHNEVTDLLKPLYNYFGISIAEDVYNQVFQAEDMSREAVKIAKTKRFLSMGINEFYTMDNYVLDSLVDDFIDKRDNFGLNLTDSSSTFFSNDTALADLDITVMTQYQLVASIAEIPATKLLGTSPKGFNATGEFEYKTYIQNLESIQKKATPMLETIYKVLLRKLDIIEDDVNIQWEGLDSPTIKEWADIDLIKAQTDDIKLNNGTLSPEAVIDLNKNDKESRYYKVDVEISDDLDLDLDLDIENKIN